MSTDIRTFRSWTLGAYESLAAVATSRDGLSGEEAARRLQRDGPNTLRPRSGHRGLRLVVRQFASPIILVLVAATVIAMALGDLVDGTIILLIIAASASLSTWQEHSAGRAVDALLKRVQVHVEVLRDGAEISVPPERVVRGDILLLRAGDVVPADCRVVETHDLVMNESALTGESYPIEKSTTGPLAANTPLPARSNSVFAGTHVSSGMGTAVVMSTGRATEFGEVAERLASSDVTTGFERGLTDFGLLLVRAMVVLVSAIFVINVVLDRPLIESFLFSLALAVGLTPQMLPAIVSVSLAAGARRMAGEQVIVKRLDAIEDIGGMTVLCVDKTGTITAGAVQLDQALDLSGNPSAAILHLARLNAGLQRGFGNPLDAAILLGAEPPDASLRIDEVPYDFQRKRLSILMRGNDGEAILVTKGAVESVLGVSADAEVDGSTIPIGELRASIDRQFAALSANGYRVLAVATRRLPGKDHATDDDEVGMTVRGLLAFHDPAKPGATDAIRELAGLGVSVRMVTGDNRLAARKIASDVGLRVETILTGDEIARLSDAELVERARSVDVFAEVEPLHKERIVRALRGSGAVVGFLGDGINDAAALHAADVGISVDSAVDVAKQSAAVVLLDKSLDVITDGVRLGRQTFANTLKYVHVTTSANFGNMLSMAGAAAVLPFLPLLPRQILLLNFLSDIPGITIAGDDVDPELLEQPFAWDIGGVRNFMLVFGLVSTCFDVATFATLRIVFGADEPAFQAAWFIESTLTELAVLLVLRTRRPFFRSRPGRALLATSVLAACVAIGLPLSPLADALGFAAVSAPILATLFGLTGAYILANETVKLLMWRRRRREPAA